MRHYSFFPGCSLEGTAKGYQLSILEVAKALEMDLVPVEDWNCCGSSAAAAIDGVASHCIAARNLALAEKRGLELVTPCPSCYTVFKTVQANLARYPQLAERVGEALGPVVVPRREGPTPLPGPYRPYKPWLSIRHLLDVIVNDVGLDTIASKRVRSLNGLKVACYYGCQVVRPWFTFDDPEFPNSLDRLVETLGGVAVPFRFKARCCGASLMLTARDVALDAVRWIVDCAQEAGANCIATLCPLCQTNLDAHQGYINRRLGTNYNVPVLFFTQLLGFALGADLSALGLKTGIVSQEKVLLASRTERAPGLRAVP
ncbi:MAG: CoB--CoM heterodisulfide reductase iron-sulfur subunit B family protein [Chloroflexota bacterium]|nr:CoB--CoM heterodisulfide reductase iron-sulfur subunit B family protein [Chloroflexota bacterium]